MHGSSSPPRGATIDGFAIGQWVVNRRAEYRRGQLSPERIRRIEAEFPDWQWLPQDEAFAAAFETGLSHLRRYVAAHGTSQVPQRDVIDGFPIGTWVATRRANYRKGRLSAERIRRIETEFPDWRWTVRPAATKSRR